MNAMSRVEFLTGSFEALVTFANIVLSSKSSEQAKVSRDGVIRLIYCWIFSLRREREICHETFRNLSLDVYA